MLKLILIIRCHYVQGTTESTRKLASSVLNRTVETRVTRSNDQTTKPARDHFIESQIFSCRKYLLNSMLDPAALQFYDYVAHSRF